MFELFRFIMGTEIRKYVRDVPKFDVQNVSDYLDTIGEKDFQATDFPNIAPIFPAMWFEWDAVGTRERYVAEYPDEDRMYKLITGVLWSSDEEPDRTENGFIVKADPRWTTTALVYLWDTRCTFPSVLGYFKVPVFRDGTIRIEKIQISLTETAMDAAYLTMEDLDIEEPYLLSAITGDTTAVVMMALSLSHCKNVEIVERQSFIPMKKKKKKPGYKYYVLEIEPMRKVLKYEGGAEKVGLKKALHICRGHFKDFRDGPGLFGKHKEVYWWNQHVRGDPAVGVVEKDYRLGEVK